MAITITTLSPKEIEASQQIFKGFDILSKLNPNQRKKVYERLEQVKLFDEEMTILFEKTIRRILK